MSDMHKSKRIIVDKLELMNQSNSRSQLTNDLVLTLLILLS